MSSSTVRLVLAASVLLAALTASRALGCTGVCLDGGGACTFGLNMDFPWDGGLVVVNKRGVTKEARDARTGTPARWTARYGSVTFDLMGYSAAFTGMNEAGLMGTMMYLPGGGGAAASEALPVVSFPLWVQYQLDTASSVREVIASTRTVRMDPAPAHFFLCDRTGECVVMEFIDGRMVIHAGRGLPVKAMSDSTYLEAVRAWRSRAPILDDRVARFAIAADLVATHARATARRGARERLHPYLDDAARVHFALFALASVSRIKTAWTIVYDSRNLRVYFTTGRNPHVREIGFAALDFSCRTPVQTLDIRAELAGDVAGALQPYAHERALAFQLEAARESTQGVNGFLPPRLRSEPPPPERSAEILSWFEDLPCAEEESVER